MYLLNEACGDHPNKIMITATYSQVDGMQQWQICLKRPQSQPQPSQSVSGMAYGGQANACLDASL